MEQIDVLNARVMLLERMVSVLVAVTGHADVFKDQLQQLADELQAAGADPACFNLLRAINDIKPRAGSGPSGQADPA